LGEGEGRMLSGRVFSVTAIGASAESVGREGGRVPSVPPVGDAHGHEECN